MSFFERLKDLLGSPRPAPKNSLGESHGSAVCGSITCMEALAKVQEYLDGELDHATREQVALHFEVCRKCYPHLRLEERFRDALRRSSEGDVCPEHLRLQVLELLAAEAGESA